MKFRLQPRFKRRFREAGLKMSCAADSAAMHIFPRPAQTIP